jgi:Flp pilus assembly pilin Flp
MTPLKNKKGQTLVEYALILVLLVAIVIAAITLLRGGANSAICTVVNSLNAPH